MLVTIVCLLNANICNQIRTNRTVALAATETSAVVSAHKKDCLVAIPSAILSLMGSGGKPALPVAHSLIFKSSVTTPIASSFAFVVLI